MIKLVKKICGGRKYIVIPLLLVFGFLAHAGLNTLPRHALIVKAIDTPFLEYGDKATISLHFEAETPINVVGGMITYPTDILEIIEIVTDESLINLWARKPTFSNELGLINFGGGIIEKGGYIGAGNVFTVVFQTIATGTADIQLEGAVMLAQDGNGTNVLSNEKNTTLYIRDTSLPSPDVNNDGALTLSDIKEVYINTFEDYREAFDINGDGDVTLSDVSSLISLF